MRCTWESIILKVIWCARGRERHSPCCADLRLSWTEGCTSVCPRLCVTTGVCLSLSAWYTFGDVPFGAELQLEAFNSEFPRSCSHQGPMSTESFLSPFVSCLGLSPKLPPLFILSVSQVSPSVLYVWARFLETKSSCTA